MENKIDYSKLSDFEINTAVAKKIGLQILANAQDGLITMGKSLSVNYCANWGDIGPIIDKIWGTLAYMEDYDEECLWIKVEEKYNCGKLRAAAIVYLMMGDEDEK